MATRMTNDEKERIKTLIRDGYTKSQISDLTGRSLQSIQTIRNELKATKGFDNCHVGGMLSKNIPCSPIADTAKEEKVEEVPRKASALSVSKRTVRFVGEGTKFEYILSSDKNYVIMRNLNAANDYAEFKVEISKLERFMNELLDLAVEAENFH